MTIAYGNHDINSKTCTVDLDPIVNPQPRAHQRRGKRRKCELLRQSMNRRDKPREHGQKQFYWELEKQSPKRIFLVPCPSADSSGAFEGVQGGNLTAGRIDLICRVISSSLFFSGGVRRDSEVSVIMGGSFRESGSDGHGGPTKDGSGSKKGKKRSNTERSVTVTGSQCTHLRPDERTVSVNLQCSVWIANGMLHKARGKEAVRKGTLFEQLKEIAREELEGSKSEEADGHGVESGSGGAHAAPDTCSEMQHQREAGEGPLSGHDVDASVNFLQGWVVRDEVFADALERCRRDALPEGGWGACAERCVLLQFDEEGDFLPDVLARIDCCKTAFVCVLGDHKGLPNAHMSHLEASDAIKVNIGPRPLLSSQCITIFQHYLDMEMDRQGLKQKA